MGSESRVKSRERLQAVCHHPALKLLGELLPQVEEIKRHPRRVRPGAAPFRVTMETGRTGKV
jgi:hypothetical protein